LWLLFAYIINIYIMISDVKQISRIIAWEFPISKELLKGFGSQISFATALERYGAQARLCGEAIKSTWCVVEIDK